MTGTTSLGSNSAGKSPASLSATRRVAIRSVRAYCKSKNVPLLTVGCCPRGNIREGLSTLLCELLCELLHAAVRSHGTVQSVST